MTNSSSPVVTVIIVNFNRENLLQKCLVALERQSFPDAEWIVVDNGSTDGSVAMVKRHFPHAMLIQNQTNLGFCAANNQGIQAAAGDYIALLNNDAVAAPDWLRELLREVESAPGVGMVASKILVHDRPEIIDKVGHLIFWDGQNRGRGSGQRDSGQFDHENEILWPDGCAALYRKRMLDEIGGFDDDFFAYADDAELGLRGRLMGWRARYAPGAIVHHHRGSTLGKKNDRRIRLIERNRLWLVWKHFPLWLVLLNPLLFASRLGFGLLAATRGRGEAGQFTGFRAKIGLAAALFTANVEAWRGLPRIWGKRAEWRRRRKLSDREVFELLRQYQISLREISENAA